MEVVRAVQAGFMALDRHMFFRQSTKPRRPRELDLDAFGVDLSSLHNFTELAPPILTPAASSKPPPTAAAGNTGANFTTPVKSGSSSNGYTEATSVMPSPGEASACLPKGSLEVAGSGGGAAGSKGGGQAGRRGRLGGVLGWLMCGLGVSEEEGGEGEGDDGGDEGDGPAQGLLCRALNVNEDLGQVQHVLTDKTGTLTQNHMVFHSFSVLGRDLADVAAGINANTDMSTRERNASVESTASAASRQSRGSSLTCHGPEAPPELHPSLVGKMLKELPGNGGQKAMEMFMLVMSACNTVVPTVVSHSASGAWEMHAVSAAEAEEEEAGGGKGAEGSGRGDGLGLMRKRGFEVEYQGESPDEVALVKAAKEMGYVLLQRSPSSVKVDLGHATFR